jgi:flagellin-specific chaperone FliS
MRKEEALEAAFIDMSSEFYVNHRKICREITRVFNDEIMHFKQLLLAFNDEYGCLESDQIDAQVQKVKEIFNNSKVMLVEDYEVKFSRNVEELTRSMYDFFVKKLNNKSPKNPSKEINERLKDMCKFGKLVNQNFFQGLVDASTLWIPWLLMLAAGAILSITCWIRVLDIMVRVIFAPIGMADIMNDGTKSSGWMYFKKLLASLLQGSILIATIKAYGMVMVVTQKMSGLATWAVPIILSFVLISLFFKASAMASDVVG